MKKKIFSILLLFSFLSCTTITTKVYDIVGNKFVKDKKDIVFNLSHSLRKHVGLYPKLSYEFKYYKYKNSLFYTYKKEKSKNLLLYVHGGAFISHDLSNSHLRTVEELYKHSKEKFEIVILDIKGQKYPEQTNELDDLLNYIIGKYDKIIVIGDSSGGNVVLSTMLRRKDEKKKLVDAVVLFSPWTDLTNTVDSRKTNFENDIFFGKVGLPKTLTDNKYAKGEDLTNPYISPIFGNYKGFPKTYIQYGEYEILSDDSVVVYENMKNANVDVKIDMYPQMFHAFQLFLLDISKEALKKTSEFMDEVYR